MAKEEEIARLKDEMRNLENEMNYFKLSEDEKSQQKAQKLSQDIKKLNCEQEKIRKSILLSPEDIDSLVKQVTAVHKQTELVPDRKKLPSQKRSTFIRKVNREDLLLGMDKKVEAEAK